MFIPEKRRAEKLIVRLPSPSHPLLFSFLLSSPHAVDCVPLRHSFEFHLKNSARWRLLMKVYLCDIYE